MLVNRCFLTRLPFNGFAGLVCAECMGLWRVEEGRSSDLLQSHPLLEGLLPGNPGHVTTAQSAQAEAEIEVLRNMVLQCSRELCKNGGSPQSIALLSFGLLYAVTYNSVLASPSGSDGDGYWNVRLFSIDCILAVPVSRVVLLFCVDTS